MEQEITELLVFIGIALLISSPLIISYIIDAYKVKKECNSIKYATRILDEIYSSINNKSELDDETKEIIFNELTNKYVILQAKYNFINR